MKGELLNFTYIYFGKEYLGHSEVSLYPGRCKESGTLCKFLTAFSPQIYSNQASDLEELGPNNIF